MNKILGNEEVAVLKEIQGKLSGAAVIGGGAVRDMHFEQPYKDVDIFLPFGNPVYARFGWGYIMDELLPDMFGVEVTAKALSDYDKPVMEKVIGKYHHKEEATFQVVDIPYMGSKYQLIFVPDMKNLTRTFDFNCNMITYDGNKVRPSKEFQLLKQNKVLENYKHYSASMVKRATALIKKYPEWTMAQSITDYIKSVEDKPAVTISTTNKFDVKFDQNVGVFDQAFDDWQFQMMKAEQMAKQQQMNLAQKADQVQHNLGAILGQKPLMNKKKKGP